MSDKELIIRLTRGDETAFSELFYAYKDKLFTFLFKLTGSRPIAEDAVQDVFLKVWHERKKFVGVQNFNAYLYKMAQNTAINGLHRQSRAALITATFDADPETSSVEELMTGKELKEILYDAIEHLPDQQKRVFEMARIEGRKYEEIAGHLGISTATVRNHLVKANKTVRDWILANYPTTGLIYCILLLIPHR